MHTIAATHPRCPVPGRVAHSHWMGHIPFAFWLVEVLRPEKLVELGAYTGVSFCAFCQAMKAHGLEGQAWAVDLWQGDANMGAYDEEVFRDLSAYVDANYATFAHLVRASFDEALTLFAEGSLDLIHIDGYHSAEAMLHDFENWLPRLSGRGVILMHDINARLPGYGGPKAWTEISSRYPSFAFDHGFGLGLVAPGKDIPEEIAALTSLDGAEAADLRRRFHEAGQIYETLFASEASLRSARAELPRREKEWQKEAEAYKAELLRQEWEKESLRKEKADAITRAAFDLEREKDRAAARAELDRRAIVEDYQRQQVELKASCARELDAYAGSLSWKLTAPLRKIGGLFRS